MRPIKEELTGLLSEALHSVLGGDGLPPEEIESSFEIPREEKFGDLSTHIALKAAKKAKRPPRPLAEETAKICEGLLGVGASPLGRRISKVAVEGPGFINFYFSAAEISGVLSRIESERESFGRPKIAKKKILLEFVSANPTGPLTVAHGRQAALGDSLARILKFCGHEVTTEYYNNDEGVQIGVLGASMKLRVERKLEQREELEFPENYYKGQYLVDLAEKFIQKYKLKLKQPYGKNFPNFQHEAQIYARDQIMEGIKKDLDDFDVHFDGFYSQEKLGASGKVEKTLEILKAKGVVYEKDGALWFRSTDFGDDKDRVLIKSDKSYTYLTPDIAYHHEKFQRGFEQLVNIWGPDHHGYIARLKASQEALGHDPAHVYILIAQLVTLYEGKKQVRMSTRAGEFVTLREILDEVGKDAGRFFFLMRKFDTHLDFDLALAKSRTVDNPVFYIQYAHARIESIKRTYEEKAEGRRRKAPAIKASAGREANLERLSNDSEIRVMRLLGQFEGIVLAAAETFEPYRLVPYLRELAAEFHRFYTDNRVVSEDTELTEARMILVTSVQFVLRRGLELLGVSAPNKM